MWRAKYQVEKYIFLLRINESFRSPRFGKTRRYRDETYKLYKSIIFFYLIRNVFYNIIFGELCYSDGQIWPILNRIGKLVDGHLTNLYIFDYLLVLFRLRFFDSKHNNLKKKIQIRRTIPIYITILQLNKLFYVYLCIIVHLCWINVKELNPWNAGREKFGPHP